MRKATARTLLAALLLALPQPAAAVRKCVDGEGRMLFTDVACPPGTRLASELDQPIQRTPQKGSAEGLHLHPRAGGPLAQPARRTVEEQHPRAPKAGDGSAAVPLVAKAMVGARFVKALADLSNLKTYSLVHYAERGGWPLGPKDLGLDPTSFHTDEIVEIGYRTDGGIVAYLSPGFGAGRWIWLAPRETLGGANLTWDCRTNVEKGSFFGFGGGCEYRPSSTAKAAAEAAAKAVRGVGP